VISQSYFNSTLVRLKVNNCKFHVNNKLYFNSTLVRLKALLDKELIGLPKFQFHIGTIKRPGTTLVKMAITHFNSTLVRLKALHRDMYDSDNVPDFNSTLVRLKDDLTVQDFYEYSNFNSTLVRLKGPLKYSGVQYFKISIPHWYD